MLYRIRYTVVIDMKSICRNQGFALVLVVVIVAILVPLSTILMSLTAQNSYINYDLAKYISCYHIAYGQLLYIIDIMETNMELIYTNFNDAYSFFNNYNDLILFDSVTSLYKGGYIYMIDTKITIIDQNSTSVEYRIDVKVSIDEVSRRLKSHIIVAWSTGLPFSEMFRVLSIREI